MTKRFVSGSCGGERCWCGRPAEHKVEETIFHDDPVPARHPLMSYICHEHFVQLMGAFADVDPFDNLRLVSKEEGLKSRTGQATPDEKRPSSCMCGVGDEACPGPDGKPLCCPANEGKK